MNYRELLKQYLDDLGSQKINTVAGLYLVSFADWLESRAAQHGVQQTAGPFCLCPADCPIHGEVVEGE